MTKIAYKLFRQLKSGKITSLFINKSRHLPYNEWLYAENYPTKGFAERPGWHCTAKPKAPHLKMELANGEKRIWKMVVIDDYTEFKRPENQGGLWYLAEDMLILDDNIRTLIENQENFDINKEFNPYISNSFPFHKKL